jgi:hypothetical protein
MVGILTTGFFVYKRVQLNPDQLIPLPYSFIQAPQAQDLLAPIIIVGDRMAEAFSRHHSLLAQEISVDLEKPIKIQTLAKSGVGIHRTIHLLKGLTQWPQILIYMGGSEEFSELKFKTSEIPTITKNFALYADDKLETLIHLFPLSSRIVYHPIDRVQLASQPVEHQWSEKDFVQRIETELMLYREHLLQLVKMSQDRSTLLILATTPINLDSPPKHSCSMASPAGIDQDIEALKKLIENDNPKEAYPLSLKLLAQYPAHAELMYLHGQVNKKLNQREQAISTLLKASAYDCYPWRLTEIQNSIIRSVAKENQILLFDFAQLVHADYDLNTTFFDEIYPQNLYYERANVQLGLVIKKILKL